MKWISSIFSKQTDETFKLKFNKKTDSWIVTRNQDIVFIGEQVQCKNYIENFENSK